MWSVFLKPSEVAKFANLGWRRWSGEPDVVAYTTAEPTDMQVWIWPLDSPPKVPAHMQFSAA